jgi:hypothetical protein
MREQQHMKIDFRTGDVTADSVLLPDASLAERAAELKEYLAPFTYPDGTPLQFFTLHCDGCDTTVPLDYDAPALPEGWTATATGEFCSACSDPVPPLHLPSPVHTAIQYDAEEGTAFTANCSCALGFDHDIDGHAT